MWFAETLARLQRSIPPIFSTVYGADPGDRPRGARLPPLDQGQAARRPPVQRAQPGDLLLGPRDLRRAPRRRDRHVHPAARAPPRRTRSSPSRSPGSSGTASARRDVPRTWAEFETYWDARARRAARRASHGRLRGRLRNQGLAAPAQGAGAGVGLVTRPLDAVSAFITIGGMPERGRELLGLPWDDRAGAPLPAVRRGVRALDPVVRRLPRRCGCTPSRRGLRPDHRVSRPASLDDAYLDTARRPGRTPRRATPLGPWRRSPGELLPAGAPVDGRRRPEAAGWPAIAQRSWAARPLAERAGSSSRSLSCVLSDRDSCSTSSSGRPASRGSTPASSCSGLPAVAAHYGTEAAALPAPRSVPRRRTPGIVRTRVTPAPQGARRGDRALELPAVPRRR